MNIRIIIPVRPLDEGKSRLSNALEPAARAMLIERMFRHVLEIAGHIGPTWVISRDPALLSLSVRPVLEVGQGLNMALEQAASGLGGTDPVLALSADLPLLVPDELRAMVAMLNKADVVAAPDRAGRGTNALLFASPGLLPYRFGENSLAAHRTNADRQGLRFATANSLGLSSDIDRPEDLAILPSDLLGAA